MGPFYLLGALPLVWFQDECTVWTCGPSTSQVTQMVKNLPAIQETQVQSLGQEDLLEKGMAYPLQYSCLENSVDRGAWRAMFEINTATPSIF